MRDCLARAYEIASERGLRDLLSATQQFATQNIQYHYRHLQRQYHQRSHQTRIPDTYELRRVDPQQVKYLVTPQFRENYPSDASFLVSGDWDQPDDDSRLMFYNPFEERYNERMCIPIDNYCFYTSIKSHLQDGVPWNETEFYQWVSSTTTLPEMSLYAQEDGREWRFSQIDRLADIISQNGYLTQAECGGNSEICSRDEYRGKTSENTHPPEHHEIMINIGRDGGLYFEEGRHRFAVARILGVDEIPVRIFVRHPQWQDKRAELSQADSPDDVREALRPYLTHPDMADVVSFE